MEEDETHKKSCSGYLLVILARVENFQLPHFLWNLFLFALPLLTQPFEKGSEREK
jgi:hypothetical protein